MSAIRIAVVSLATAAFVSGAFAPAAVRGADTKPATGLTPVEAAMEDIEGSLEVLTRNVKDPAKRDANLVLLSKMQHAVLICKQQTPEPVRKLEGDAKAKLLHTYRSMLITLLREMLLAEEHLIAGRHEEAAKSVAKLEEIEEAGHKALGVEPH